jgi:ankyrin repeat protein
VRQPSIRARVAPWFLLVFVVAAARAAALDDTRLASSMKAGDTATVRRLVQEGADVNVPLGDGATALHWAAHLDDHESADLLIRAGARVNAANDLGVTPLWIASTNGSAPMIERLLEAGADPNAGSRAGVTPLMQAARAGSVEAVTLLTGHKADVNSREHADAQTALMLAVSHGHVEVVRQLTQRGADVHARSKVWRQRVLTCCERYLGDSEGITDIDQGGFTPLLFAARLGDVESAGALLAGGADINETAPDGTSVLALAALSGHGALASFLLERGADPNAAAAGYTPLHAAVLRGDLGLVKSLLGRGARPDAPLMKGTPTRRNEKTYAADWAFDRAWSGATPLWLAARFAELDMMRVLVTNGADIRRAANDGTSPLMVAAKAETVPSRRGQAQKERESRAMAAIALALTFGANINDTTSDGDTVLHIAAAKRSNAIVEFLVQNGAMLNVRNNKDQTPLAVALLEPEAPKGIAVVYSRQVNDGSTAALLRKLGATQ